MARIYRIGDHVGYIKPNGRIQSATVTNVDSATQLDLRIGHHSTHLNKIRHVSVPVSGTRSGKWRRG